MAIESGFSGLAVTYLARLAYRVADAVRYRGNQGRPHFEASPREATLASSARDRVILAMLLIEPLTEEGRSFGDLALEAWDTSVMNPMMWVREYRAWRAESRGTSSGGGVGNFVDWDGSWPGRTTMAEEFKGLPNSPVQEGIPFGKRPLGNYFALGGNSIGERAIWPRPKNGPEKPEA